MLVGDPKRPGLRIERVQGGREAWSCRVTKAIRIIYRLLDSNRIQLLRVGKHDAAYRAGVLYWLAAPTVEEEIRESELERSKMFAPSINGIEEGLSEIEELVRDARVDDVQSIAGVLRRLISNTAGEGTEGKAAVRIPQDMAGPVNVIPGEHEGECRQVLLGLCFDHDNLDDRLREIVYHAGIYCQEETRLVVIVTSQWDPKKWNKHEKAFADLNAKVVIFVAAFRKFVRIV